MRLGVVRGSVVLSLAVPELEGIRLAIIEPVTRERLALGRDYGGGKSLIAADRLGSGVGQVVGFVEGRTAASPFWPEKVPVDAYCAFIAENIEYHPPEGVPATPESVGQTPRGAPSGPADALVGLPAEGRPGGRPQTGRAAPRARARKVSS